MISIRFVSALLLVPVLAGCSDYPRVDAVFGDSQAHMIEVQTYDPAAAAHPPELLPAVSDGQRLENVLTVLRTDVPQGTKQVSQTQQFQVGGNGGG